MSFFLIDHKEDRRIIGGAYTKGPIDENMCLNQSGRMFGCTRVKDHTGLHVAHGPDSIAYAIWDNDNLSKG